MQSRVVLVTGADGFTGRYLVRALAARGENVIPVAGPSGAVHPCDLSSAPAVTSLVQEVAPTHVIHLAGLAFVGHMEPDAFYRVNVHGTTNLLEALARLPVPPRQVIVASSANVYGRPRASTRIREDQCPAPVNHYACSKLAMEHLARTWGDAFPVTIVRPFNYTGPGQPEHFLVPKIVSHFARRASDIELGNLDVSRDFSDIRDIVSAYVALLDHTQGDTTCNLCSGHPTSLRDIIATLEQLAGYRIQVRVNPAFVRQNEIASLTGDSACMHALTGVRMRPFRETLEYCYHAALESAHPGGGTP